MNWYLQVLKKYATVTGRARRKEYWMFALVNFVISLLLGFVSGFASALLGLGEGLSNFVTAIYTLALLVPAIAVGVRRMHDIGRSGWWILFPFVNLVFLCFDSQPGDNEYGPNPKAA